MFKKCTGLQKTGSVLAVGLKALLATVIDMEKRRVDRQIGQGALQKKDSEGNHLQIKYGYDIKLGINEPEQ